MLVVGKILKAHGIRGDVKAECFMDSPDCFSCIKYFYIDGKKCSVENFKIFGNFVLLKFVGINDMNSAETLRGKELSCEQTELPVPDKGRFYVSDIIGCKVYDGINDYGKITDILQYGSADVIVAEKKGQRIMFPWIRALNVKVDIESKLFFVNSEKLSEVVLYEN